MADRLLLDKIDHDAGTVTLADGSVRPLTTNDFPTVDPADPYTLTPEEQHIIDKLVSEFVTADHLHRHIDFLYTHAPCIRSPTATCCSTAACRSTKTAPLAV